MAITQQDHATLLEAIRGGQLQGEQLNQAAQLIADFENQQGQGQGQGQGEVQPQPRPQEAAASPPLPSEGSYTDYIQNAPPLVQEGVAKTAELLSATAGEAAGIAQAGYELAQAGADFIGKVTGSETVKAWADRQTENQVELGQAAETLARDITSNMLGRPANPEEIAAISKEGQETGKLIGSIGLGVAGGMGTLAAKGVMSTVAVGAAEGGFWGFMGGDAKASKSDQRYDERLGDAKVGGIMGTGVGILPGAVLGARNFLLKQVADTDGIARKAWKLADEYGITLTFGQASENTLVQNVETTVQGTLTQKLMAKQGMQAAKGIAGKLGIKLKPLAKSGTGNQTVINQVFDGLSLRVAKLNILQNKRWAADMKVATDLTGDTPILVPGELTRQTIAVMDDITNTFKGDVKISNSFARIQEEMKEATTRGGATMKELDEWWKEFNSWKGAKGGILDAANKTGKQRVGLQQAWAGRLTGSLKAGIDAAQGGAPGSSKALGLQVLKKARTTYSKSSSKIHELERTFLQAMGGEATTPAQLATALTTGDVDVVRRAVHQLRQLDGGEMLVDQLRASIYDTAVNEASNASLRISGQAGDLDVEAFRNALGANTKRSIMAGLITPAQEKKVVEGIDLLGNVLNGQIAAKRGVVIKRMLPVGLQEMAINAISRDTGFVARLAANAVTRGKGLEGLLFTDTGLNMLRQLSPDKAEAFGKIAAGRNAAIVGLIEMIKAGSIEDALKEE